MAARDDGGETAGFAQLTVAGPGQRGRGGVVELLLGVMLTRLGGEGGKVPARVLEEVSACISRG